jgi:hypothetical protein
VQCKHVLGQIDPDAHNEHGHPLSRWRELMRPCNHIVSLWDGDMPFVRAAINPDAVATRNWLLNNAM